MIVVLPDGKLINLNLVCFTDTRSFKEPVRFSMVNGESVLCEMTEDQYQSMLLSLVPPQSSSHQRKSSENQN